MSKSKNSFKKIVRHIKILFYTNFEAEVFVGFCIGNDYTTHPNECTCGGTTNSNRKNILHFQQKEIKGPYIRAQIIKSVQYNLAELSIAVVYCPACHSFSKEKL